MNWSEEDFIEATRILVAAIIIRPGGTPLGTRKCQVCGRQWLDGTHPDGHPDEACEVLPIIRGLKWLDRKRRRERAGA